MTAQDARTVSANHDDPMVATSRPRRPDLGALSGVIVVICLIVVFSLWDPERFASIDNARIIAASQAITGLLTMGVVVSLVAGVFDLSVGATMTVAVCLVGWLQASQGMNAGLAALLAVLAGSTIGAVNAFIVLRLHVDPVIGTLGMSSVLIALAFLISGGNAVFDGLSPTFTRFGTERLLTVPAPVYYLAVLSLILWYVLEHTPLGRYLYAVGSNADASRLAGLRVARIQCGALIVSSTLAAVAGVVLTMQLSAAPFSAGAPYLLPAYAVAFLGSTQIKPGRFNVLGTLVALFMLAIGVKGLQLQYPSVPWIQNLFEGSALILAVAIAARSVRRREPK